jgi:hypothetical protein
MAHSRRCCLWTPNGRIEKFLHSFDKANWKQSGAVNIFILRANNQGGKTTSLVNIAAYLAQPFCNQWLDSIDYLRNFKRPNRGRIYTTVNAAKTTYADAIPKWWEAGRYKATKGGTTFDCNFTFKNGSSVDIFTFDRDPIQGESTTLDWVIVDEPLPQALWTGLISRLSHGGIIIIGMTALEGSGWINTDLESAERLGKDVHITVMTAEDCCIEHGIRGHLPHAYIDNLRANCDEDELTARLEGKYIHLSGAVYKQFSEVNIINTWPDYLRPDWESKKYQLSCVIDPHDRKPFAIGWYATFKNGDTVCLAEFPDDTFPMFHKMTDCGMVTADYAKWIKDTENNIGKPADVRIIDPNFGKTPCFSSKLTIAQEFSECGLFFGYAPDDIAQGHLAVKELLGNVGNGKRAKLYFADGCKNHIFGMKNYQWKTQRTGISEKPELLYKDFPDLVRYGAMSCFAYDDYSKIKTAISIPENHGRSGYKGL